MTSVQQLRLYGLIVPSIAESMPDIYGEKPHACHGMSSYS